MLSFIFVRTIVQQTLECPVIPDSMPPMICPIVYYSNICGTDMVVLLAKNLQACWHSYKIEAFKIQYLPLATKIIPMKD